MNTRTRCIARVAAAILTTMLFSGMATPAGAHTAPVPVEITPSPGSELSQVPSEVVLRFDGDFTDDIEAGLVDSTGTVIPGLVSVEGRTVRVQVENPSSLPDDTYRIFWYARTTHGSDAPDGIGAESRQVHFFVGTASSGRVLQASADADTSSAGLGMGALGAVLLIAGGSFFVVGRRGRRILVPLTIGSLCAVGALVLSADDTTSSSESWSTQTEDGISLAAHSGSEWTLQIEDANGLATPWATGAQLRFTDPTSGDSEIVDLTVDIASLGRLHAPAPGGTEGWEVELVVSTFAGPVHNFSLSAA